MPDGTRGVTPPGRRAEGMRIRRELLGDDYVDRSAAGADDLTADFVELAISHAWADVWARPGLDRRTRSCITLAILAALGCEEELAMHVPAALRARVTRDEVKEVLLQVAVYASLPRAHRAFAIARVALAAMEED